MLYGNHGPYVPRYQDAVCDFPRCRCEYMCNVAVPRRAYSAALSRWAIYGPHGPYIPPDCDREKAVKRFLESDDTHMLFFDPPLTPYARRGAFWSRWAIYGALAFLAVVAVVLATWRIT